MSRARPRSRRGGEPVGRADWDRAREIHRARDHPRAAIRSRARPRGSRRHDGRRDPARRSQARRAPRAGRRAPPAPRAAEWCGLERALAADPDDGRMCEVGAETLLRAQAPAERLEHAERDLLLRAAAAADQVAVPLDVRAMPSRHAIVEMGVRHVAEVLECLEIAVDGRGIDLRMSRAHLTRDLFSGRVVPRPLERVEHQPALHRHPLALRADLIRHAHFVTCSISRLRLETRSGLVTPRFARLTGAPAPSLLANESLVARLLTCLESAVIA